MNHELVAAAPPVGVATLTFAGVALSQWVLIATLVYTVILILKHIPGAIVSIRRGLRWLKEHHDKSHRS